MGDGFRRPPDPSALEQRGDLANRGLGIERPEGARPAPRALGGLVVAEGPARVAEVDPCVGVVRGARDGLLERPAGLTGPIQAEQDPPEVVPDPGVIGVQLEGRLQRADASNRNAQAECQALGGADADS